MECEVELWTSQMGYDDHLSSKVFMIFKSLIMSTNFVNDMKTGSGLKFDQSLNVL